MSSAVHKLTGNILPYHIELATQQHSAETLASLINKAYQAVAYRIPHTDTVSQEDVKHLIHEGHLYVCLSPDQTLYYGTVSYEPQSITVKQGLKKREETIAELFFLAVDPLYQGYQLGSLLIRHVEHELAEQRFQKISLYVLSYQQEHLMKYFQRLGFHLTGHTFALPLEIASQATQPQLKNPLFLYELVKPLLYKASL
jgi:ribosomal protein S18 acetylase RimI-like enzyme